MATNIIYEQGDQIPLDVSAVSGSGTGDAVLSDDPGVVGTLAFVALNDADGDGIATAKTNGVAELAVHGHDGTADTAIGAGDEVYWDNTAGELNVDTSGARFGYAVAAVASGATADILVKIGY